MLQQLLAIARNTFFESVRQPVTLVVVIAACLLLVLANPLSAFTMDDDQRMLIDIGLATVFLAGAVLAAFIATSVLGREIENRTALTVISKPVSRPVFLLGKFLGASGALLLATLILSAVFMLVELHAVLQTVRDPINVPVIVFSSSAVVLAGGVAVWCNYFYGTVFASTVLFVAAPLLLLAYLLSMNFEADFTSRGMALSFKGNIWLAIIAVVVSIMMLCAIAVAVSTRLGQLMTLLVTVGMFMLGLLSDWLLGRPIRSMEDRWLARASERGLTSTETVTNTIERTSGEIEEVSRTVVTPTIDSLETVATNGELIGMWLLEVGYAILPNFQILWLSDALTQDIVIPTSYLTRTIVYAVIYMLIALAAGVMLFQRRDLG